MASRAAESRRYLVSIDTTSVQQWFTDCVVIGSGIAGLRAALEAAESCRVLLLSKAGLDESNTWNAQGGIAAVTAPDDSEDDHVADTLQTGCGLCDEQTVRLVVSKGPALVRQLIDWGTAFDRVDGRIDVTREGGHHKARILHAHGDSTGRGIVEALRHRVDRQPNIRVLEPFFTIDLLTDPDGRCVGVVGFRNDALQVVWATVTILATGGAGRLYRETTNPPAATADGLAMAYRAGAVLRDMEFMQFHPTTLYVAGASRALITETLRGEGAILRDADGTRFMPDYHPDGELAPRDVVSRAILAHMLKTGSTHVFLDVRHFDKAHFARRFPRISELCESFDIDVAREMIPVRPSAHYMIGGVKTDHQTRTTVPGLLACGEVASTGLHGANRLGSNSLLEGLVFGQIAGQHAGRKVREHPTEPRFRRFHYDVPASDRSRLDTGDVRNSLRALMWRNVGITRRDKHLGEALDIIRFWQRYVMDKRFDSPYGWECQNMLTVCHLMAQAARQRRESRGVHYRDDYPEPDDSAFLRHIELSRND